MKGDWPIVPLGDVLNLAIDSVEVEPNNYYKISGVYSFGRGLIARGPLLGAETTYKVFHCLHEDDFVISHLKAWEGALARVTSFFDGWFLSPQFSTFRPDPERLEIAFLEWYCKQSRVWDALRNKARGMGARRDSVLPSQFLSLSIPLPAVAEQRRIVARIEELAARIEEARELRRRAVEETEALIFSARSVFFSEEFNKNWPIMILGDVTDIRAGVTLGRRLSGPTIKLPYLRVANVQDGYLDLSLIKEIEILESELEKWQLQDGDILLTEGGDWDKLGRGAVWHNEIQGCIHQNHIFRLRVNPNEFDPEYLCSLIGSTYGKNYFQAASKQTTNLASINQRQLKAFKAFKPPLEEQRRIIAYLDSLQSKLDALKRHQEETAAELDALLPAVLERAFRGEL